MKDITIIGDVHGKVNRYKEIVGACSRSICVGDFGFKEEWDNYLSNIDSKNHVIVMGNHDYIPYMDDRNYWLKCQNFGQIQDFPEDIFYVRGAYSVDKYLRKPGIDWFGNEELDYQECGYCMDLYMTLKPRIVISHDCPQFLRTRWFGITDKSITSNLLDAMWKEHQPEIWIFGHHHKSKSEVLGNTTFTCLAELETKIIEV